MTDIFYTVVTGADQSAQASSEMKTYIDNADLDSANSGIASMSMSGNTITMDITKANFGGSGIVSGMAGEFNVTVSKIEVGGTDYNTDAVSAAGAMKTAIQDAATASAATVETGKTATGSISQTIKLTFSDGSVGTYTLVANWAVPGTMGA